MALKVNANDRVRKIADRIKDSVDGLPEKGGTVKVAQDVVIGTLPDDISHDQFTRALNHQADFAVATEVAAAELAAEKGNLKEQDNDYKLMIVAKLTDDVKVTGQVKKREETSGGFDRDTGQPRPRQERFLSSRSSIEIRTTTEHQSYREEMQNFAKAFLAQ